MNILLVTETYVPTISGVANSTDSIARYMVSRGHTVTVVTPAPLGNVVRDAARGLRIVTAPSIRDPLIAEKPMTVFPWGFGTIWRAVHRDRYDLVHIQEPGSLGISALILAKIVHIPTVGAAHTTPQQVASFFGPLYGFGLVFAKAWTQAVYNHYDAVMTPTETMAGYLRKAGIHVPIYPVSNGIEVGKYAPGRPNPHIHVPFTLPKKRVLFGYLGRIDADKHLDVAVRAMRETDKGVHLVIAGFGKEQANLQRIARDLHVTKNVTFIGTLNEQEIIQLYRFLDCFVIPSPVESQSIVTLQAIACGLPVIAVNAGALPELVHDGKNGFLVKTDDYHALAEKMNTLAQDAVLRKKFAGASRALSLTHDKPKALHTLEEVYLGLLR